MNIPLDRLYHYIENIAEKVYGECVIIYRFWPHGSKNINDLNPLYQIDWYKKAVFPIVWCYDQEPLNYEFYKNNSCRSSDDFSDLLKSVGEYLPCTNLNYRKNIFEKGLLLHSEQRSSNLEKYQIANELIPVYYWSHGIISRDWFRYAEHITQKKKIQKTFLIYNRAWSGTREYRLRFTEFLIRLGLLNHCQITVNPIDPALGIHYNMHQFKNPAWRPTTILENFFPTNIAPAVSSADFDCADYNATDIEVILETLFDDDRLHLTEKSLRPIACSQPFILAGTHGSLEYLRSYGFKTFNTVWDESYDQITDPEERLTAIVGLMQQISTWNDSTKKKKLLQAQEIADYNQQWFFSQRFFDVLTTELKTNLQVAFKELDQCNNYKSWIDRWDHIVSYPEVVEFLKTNQDHNSPTLDTINQTVLMAQNKLAEVALKNKS